MKNTSKKYFLIVYFFMIVFFMLHTASSVSASNVYVFPMEQTVFVGDDFFVDVYCLPSEPIKAFELILLYDKELLYVVDVVEGDFFSGYPTFFNEGVINNKDGTVSKVYNLIIGQGNITEQGSFIRVFLKAKESGSARIDFKNLGICNETQYIPSASYYGTVYVLNRPGGSSSGGGTPFPSDDDRFFVPPSYDNPSNDSFYVVVAILFAVLFIVCIILYVFR